MTMMAPVRAIVERPYRISLLAGPAAAAQARRHVAAIIQAWGVPVEEYTAALLTSELVTNAIRHASTASAISPGSSAPDRRSASCTGEPGGMTRISDCPRAWRLARIPKMT